MAQELEINKHRTDQLVFIVDDEPDMLSMLKLVIERKCGCRVLTATSGGTALELLSEYRPDVIVSDIKMPDLDGLELLKKIRQHDTTISVVIMTGFGTIDMAVQALKDGAYDFLQKPFDKSHIVRVVENCLERTALLRTNLQLQKKLRTLSLPEGFIGNSAPLRAALELLQKVADTDATVLIRGESGTGKELAARALHSSSNRKNLPMITVNCPALPEQVLESELFGYARGAFTGANQSKKGLFLEADGSTILLDEIADIPVTIQTKLLRVLQEKEIQPLGQNQTIKVDVRVVASTNQDLEAKIQAGEFREDLFYRLNVVTVTMPNLQEMDEDIPLLVQHFLVKYKHRYNREELTLLPEVLNYLYNCKWSGNVRELQNTMKRLVLLSGQGTIRLTDLSDLLQADTRRGAACKPSGYREFYDLSYNEAKTQIVSQFSRSYLSNLLTIHAGNVTRASKTCGLERQALQRLLRKYSLASADFKK